MLFHEAAEVAVGEDAGEFAVGGCDGGHAEFFGGHFVEGGGHGSFWRNARQGFAGVHEVFDAEEFLAEVAGGVKGGKVVVLKAPAVKEGNGEGVADGHRYCGAGGGGEIEGA